MGHPNVFLSYSREDQSIARKLVTALELSGCSVWWDGLLEGGERFSQTTEAALEAAQAVVVLWSKTSARSHWVHDEATSGRDNGRLVPASIDGTPPPLGFGQFQALDLSRWKGNAKAPIISDLVRAIAIVAGQEPPTTSVPPAKTSRRGLLVGGGVAGILAVGGGLAAWRFGSFGDAAAQINSVAVIPFRNLSGDSAMDYLAEGLSEEVRSVLAQNSLLKVVAQVSSRAFREGTISVQDIAQQLGVSSVLTGSVRNSGDVLRVATRLTDGNSGADSWSQSFDRSTGDLLSVQREIANKVADALTGKIGAAAATRKLSQAAAQRRGQRMLQSR